MNEKKSNQKQQKLQSLKKLLELNIQTQGPILLTFTHLNNLYSCKWATWTEEKHQIKKKELTKLIL